MRANCKRAISCLIAVFLLAGLLTIPAQAESGLDQATTAYNQKQLTDLGILTYEVTEDMYAQPVSRLQTYGAALGLLGDLTTGLSYENYAFSDISGLPEANKIQFAYEQGCVAADWRFEPQTNCTVGEALRLITSEMGYQEVAKTLGDGNSGYMVMANRLGLLDGLSVGQNDTLTWEVLITILHNSLDVEILHLLGYNNDGSIVGKITGATMLNVYFDIYKVSGIVNANEYTSLNGDQNAGNGYVIVGTQKMKVGNTAVGDYLGYYTDCYAKLKNDVYTVISAEKSLTQNRTWTISAEDLLTDNADWSAFCIVYQKENGSTGQLKLPSDVSVIYNGKQLFDYNEDDLKIVLGDITAVDNNADGTPETVLVHEYKNYVVDSYNETQQILYSKNYNPLDLSDSDKISVKSVNGDDYLLSDLTENTVLSLSISRDEKYIYGMAVKIKISGELTQLSKKNGKTLIKIGNNTYTVSPAWNGKDINGKNITLAPGRNYLVYTDQMGYAAVFIEKNSGLQYGFLYAASIQRAFGATIKLKLFTDSGAWEELDLANKVTVNGVSYKQADVADLNILFENRKAKQQMLKVMVGDDNKINKIYTANGLDRTADQEALSGVLGINKTTTYKTIGVFSDYTYSLNGAKIFILPKINGEYDDERFDVVGNSALKNDRSYLFNDFYDVSDTMQVKVAVMEKGIANYDYWNNYAVYVKSVTDVYDNGEIKSALECLNKGVNVTYYSADDKYVEDVKPGDILAVHLNSDGKIDAEVKKIYDAASKAVTESLSVNEKETHSAWYGTITAKDENSILLTQENGNKRCVPVASAKYITFYDLDEKSDNKRFRNGTANEISKDAKAIVYIRSGECMDITVME